MYRRVGPVNDLFPRVALKIKTLLVPPERWRHTGAGCIPCSLLSLFSMFVIDLRGRRKGFQFRCHGTAIQGMTKHSQPESVQGVTGKAAQTTLLVCHPMNPHFNLSSSGYVANKGTSGKRLFLYCQRALPCAAKYTGRQRFQERMPICVTVKLQADG